MLVEGIINIIILIYGPPKAIPTQDTKSVYKIFCTHVDNLVLDELFFNEPCSSSIKTHRAMFSMILKLSTSISKQCFESLNARVRVKRSSDTKRTKHCTRKIKPEDYVKKVLSGKYKYKIFGRNEEKNKIKYCREIQIKDFQSERIHRVGR